MTDPGVPFRATYRVQLHKDFTFRDATSIVDYLADLGFSHLYCSPIMKARPGSTHGYDIVDHNNFNPEIGSEEDFEALVAALRGRGMGILLDIVPNHMGVGPDNRWWLDVLEWGQLSPYARYFDIDWNSHRRNLEGKVLLPVLGDQFGAVLEKGEIELKLDRAAGSFEARYYAQRFPICPFDYPTILKRAADALSGIERDRVQGLSEQFSVLQKLRQDPARLREKAGDAKQALSATVSDAAIGDAIARATASFSGQPERPDTWHALGRLLDQQAYRPAYWRVASDEINYRRFFNINDLGGIRVELQELFEETHRKTLRLAEDGKLDGLRVDHIDGLFDPKQYLERLQARAGRPGRPYYIIVEKILAHYEDLPEDWPVAGTTGYDTINLMTALFTDPDGERPLSTFYRRSTGRREAFEDILYDSKKRILEVNLASEVSVLANEMHRLSSSHWRSRDFTLNGMRAALEEVIARFPVYRTYVDQDGPRPSDCRYIDWAIGIAKKRSTQADTSIYDFLRDVLTLALARNAEYPREDVLFLAMRFQQLSGPVMAKGLEDTSFYRYFRLISLNEVGGDPRRFSVSIPAFHRENEKRLKLRPLDMIGGSTHDTKRGEDARARLSSLSSMPEEWNRRVATWERLNRRLKAEVDGQPAPDRNDEYYFYQSLLGVWPLELQPTDGEGTGKLADRMEAALIKAVREGKEKSSWANPDEAYERALTTFARRALEGNRPNPFLADFNGFIGRVARLGALTAVSETLLRLTMPGMPDTYRGAELWDLSMVDPDNRRPVDYAAYRSRFQALKDLGPASPEVARELAQSWQDGRLKLAVLWRTLALRQERPRLFSEGEYIGLEASGTRANSVVAFRRAHEQGEVIVVAPRFWPRLLPADAEAPDWGDTAIPLSGSFADIFTGVTFEAGAVGLERLLADFPVALLLAS